MDNDYLMTVLTREDLAHGGKIGVNEMTDVFMGGKSLWVRVTLASTKTNMLVSPHRRLETNENKRVFE